MNILHVGKYYAPFHGGIENVTRDLMRKHKEQGHVVSALVHHSQSGRLFSDSLDGDIPIYRMPIQGILLFVPIALFAVRYLRSVILKQRPELLHLHMPNIACFWCLLLPAARKLPWVVHWHSDVVGEKPDWRVKLLYPLYWLLEQWLLKRATKIVVTSPNYLASSKPLQRWKNKCVVIPLAIEVERHHQLKTKDAQKSLANEVRVHDGQPKLDLSLICIGRLTYYKGHRFLIEAIKLVEKSGINCHLDVIGEGEIESELRQLVDQLGLNDTVVFNGKLSQPGLQGKLNSADVLILPSIERTEAFGLVLLEAMREAKPCIVTDVPGSGMSYVVENNHTGLVVARHNSEALKNAILHLAHRPDIAREFGRNGAKRLASEFSLSMASKRFIEIYNTSIVDRG